LMAFSVSPTQLTDYSALTSKESGAKASQGIKVPVGIALLIELGVKAVRIIQMLKDVGQSGPSIDQIVQDMANPTKRKKVLDDAGMEPDKFYKASRGDDAKVILEYCKDYINNNKPSDPTVFDHWIAYGNVAARNNLLRSALDTATNYSKDFSDAFDKDAAKPGVGGNLIQNFSSNNPHGHISAEIGSHYNDLDRESDSVFDQILNTFMYQVTDADLCCLVEIFGSMDTGGLKLISQILKILATDLQAELAILQDAFLRLLVNAATSAVYAVIARLNKVADDLGTRMIESIEDIQKELGFELDHCPTFKDIGIALAFGIDGIRGKVGLMLMDILSYTEQLGSSRGVGVSWDVPAERRHLLTIAKIFDVLSSKLDAAKACESSADDAPYTVDQIVGEAKDQAAHEIIHTLLDKSPPSIQISDDDVKKYFPNLVPSKSRMFGFVYGPKTIFPDLVGQRAETLNNCGVEMTEERRQNFQKVISNAMTNRFKQDG